jgi:hypothetical protein
MKDPNAKRRPRTTSIMIAVPTTLKAVGEYLGANPATIAARYHRIQDAYPRRVVTLEALAESHRGKTIR